jgi:TRAP-type C4-dicarboxylate transport system permease large subunit
VSKSPRTAQLAVAVAVELIVIFFAMLVFVVGGYRVAENAWDQQISTLPVSVGQVYMVLLLAGTIMDPTPAILIVTPIFLPVVTSVGVDPIHFGAMMVFNMCLGNISPPIGNNLFVAARVRNVKIEPVIGRLMPFFWALCIALPIVTYVPELSTWLPTQLGFIDK